MLYRVNFMYDLHLVSLFVKAEDETEAYDKALDKLDTAKEIVHLGTNMVNLPYIEYLDYIPWYAKNGEKMFCYKCYVNDNKRMMKHSEIEENAYHGCDKYYLEFEVSFDREKRLVQYHMLMQDHVDHEWTEPELLGSEVYLHEPNGKIVGHSLLTDEEFRYILYLAKEKLDEVYDEFDFEDKEDEAC